jgi:hypothetical protein
MFLVIVGVIFCLQVLLVSFGGIAFGVYPHFGLTAQQWGISVYINLF